MKIKKFILPRISVILLIFFVSGSLPVYGKNGDMSLGEGEKLPDFKIASPLSPQDCQYMGIPAGSDFTLKEIKARLLVIEIFSALCPECHKNVPRINKLFNIISNDADLNKNVKMLGIAAGNNAKLTEVYRKTYQVKFPLFADPKKDIDRQLGHMTTPSIIIADHSGTILYLHEGLMDDMDLVLDILRTGHSR